MNSNVVLAAEVSTEQKHLELIRILNFVLMCSSKKHGIPMCVLPRRCPRSKNIMNYNVCLMLPGCDQGALQEFLGRTPETSRKHSCNLPEAAADQSKDFQKAVQQLQGSTLGTSRKHSRIRNSRKHLEQSRNLQEAFQELHESTPGASRKHSEDALLRHIFTKRCQVQEVTVRVPYWDNFVHTEGAAQM